MSIMPTHLWHQIYAAAVLKRPRNRHALTWPRIIKIIHGSRPSVPVRLLLSTQRPGPWLPCYCFHFNQHLWMVLSRFLIRDWHWSRFSLSWRTRTFDIMCTLASGDNSLPVRAGSPQKDFSIEVHPFSGWCSSARKVSWKKNFLVVLCASEKDIHSHQSNCQFYVPGETYHAHYLLRPYFDQLVKHFSGPWSGSVESGPEAWQKLARKEPNESQMKINEIQKWQACYWNEKTDRPGRWRTRQKGCSEGQIASTGVLNTELED